MGGAFFTPVYQARIAYSRIINSAVNTAPIMIQNKKGRRGIECGGGNINNKHNKQSALYLQLNNGIVMKSLGVYST